MDKDLKKVVVLLAHPNMENSQANKALFDAIKEMDDVAIFNLYEMPDENILNMDAWSRIISHANAVIYQFPFYWMSAPSLLKKWQDEIFTYLAKTPAVAGKPLTVNFVRRTSCKDPEAAWHSHGCWKRAARCACVSSVQDT